MRTQYILTLSLIIIASVANAELADVAETSTRGRPNTGAQSSDLSSAIDCVYLLVEKGYPYSSSSLDNIAKPIRHDSPEKALILNSGEGEDCRHCTGQARTAGLLLKSGVYTAPISEDYIAKQVKDANYYVHMNITGVDVPNLFVTQMDTHLFSEWRKQSGSFNSWGTEIFWPHVNRGWKQNVAKERDMYVDVQAQRASSAERAAMIGRVENLLRGRLAGMQRTIYEKYESYRDYFEGEQSDVQRRLPKEVAALEVKTAELIDSIKRGSRTVLALEQQLKRSDMNGLLRNSVERDIEARKLANVRARYYELPDLKRELADARGLLARETEELPIEQDRLTKSKAEADAKLAKLKAELAPACNSYFQ